VLSIARSKCSGAVAAEPAKDGKKKTILRHSDNPISLLIEDDMTCGSSVCHGRVSDM
jgi:hypothetical protein